MSIDRPKRRALRLAVGGTVMAVLLGVCMSASSATTSSAAHPVAAAPLKVALILGGAINDGDYNQMGYVNFEAAIKYFGSKVESTVKENVADGPGVAQVADSLIAAGYTLFFVNTTGMETYLQPVAKAHPNIRVEEFESAVTGSNYGAYNINLAQSAYIAGMILAGASHTGDLGVVTSFPFPDILTTVNGLELGAQAVNPKATLHVLFVSSFYDPATERQAAKALVSDGVDALVDTQNDATVCQVAQSDGIPCVGQTMFNGPSYGPTTYLTDFRLIWTPIFKQVMADVLAKRPVPTSLFEGYPQGATGLGPFGPAYDNLVSASVRAKAVAKQAEIRAGTFNPYQGPIYDQQGKLKVPAGKSLSASQILSLTWVVKGVIGKVSS